VRIYFKRTGGFAGIRLETMIDSDTLPPEEAAKLLDMVESADFFSLPPKITVREIGADQFQYKVTIESKERQHSVEMQEAAIPPTLRPLVTRLTASAKKHNLYTQEA